MRVSEVHNNNNWAFEISGFKVRVLLLMHIRLECFCIPRASVTFTVSVTLTGTARPAGSNAQEERMKERLGVTKRRGSNSSVFMLVWESNNLLLSTLPKIRNKTPW